MQIVDDVKDEIPVARCLFFSQDRADVTFVSKLKRLVRYLKGKRQWIQVFEFGDMGSEVTVFSDSDWAGDKETRFSSSARGRLCGTTSFECVHKKTEDHRQKQCRGRAVCSSIGSVRSDGSREHDE